jgi:glyceraldehyde 3-phosphate dehydrogenase
VPRDGKPLEFDSIHGRWHTSFAVDDEARLSRSAASTSDSLLARRRADVPGDDLGCDIVLECTGKFLKPAELDAYFSRGVKTVIVAAPVKDAAALNVVMGVNDGLYEPQRHRLLTAASARPTVSRRWSR